MSIKLSGKNSSIGREKVFAEDTMRILFPMNKCLTLTASITFKMVVYGPLIGRKQIEEADKIASKFAAKVIVRLVVCSESVAPLFCLKKALSIIIVTSRKYHLLLLYDTETVNLETTGTSNKIKEQHMLTKEHKTGVPNIFHHLFTRIPGQLIVPT